LQTKKLAEEVAEMFRNVLRLHMKMTRNRTSKSATSSSGLGSSSSSSSSAGGSSSSSGGSSGSAAAGSGVLASESEDETLEAAELTDYSPRQLSFWIAHAFTVRCAVAVWWVWVLAASYVQLLQLSASGTMAQQELWLCAWHALLNTVLACSCVVHSCR
jgi:uncharacterized membrane protein YgcG